MLNKTNSKNKETFLKIFKNNEDYGEIDLSCEEAGISKSVFQDWIKEDSLFWEKVEEIKDEKYCYLADLVMKRNVEASKKFLLIYGKDRGFSAS